MVDAEPQLRPRRRPPQQAARDVRRTTVAAVDVAVRGVLADVDSIPEGIADRTIDADRRLTAVESSVGHECVPRRRRGRRRLLRDGVDGAGHGPLSVQYGRRASQQLHAVEVEGVLRPHDHVGRTEPDPVAENRDLRPCESPDREARRCGRVVPRHHSRQRLERIAQPLVAAGLHHRAVDDVDRRRDVERAQPQTTAGVGLPGKRQLASYPCDRHLLLERGGRKANVETHRRAGGHRHGRRDRREPVPGHGHAVRAGRQARECERPVRSRGDRLIDERFRHPLQPHDRRRQRRAADFVHDRALQRAGRLSVCRNREHHARERQRHQADPVGRVMALSQRPCEHCGSSRLVRFCSSAGPPVGVGGGTRVAADTKRRVCR